MIRRPKGGETEEDLLKFQQDFLRSGKDSAASVVKRTDKRKPDSGGDDRDRVKMEAFPSKAPTLEPAPAKKSKFRASQEAACTDHTAMEEDPYKTLDKHDKHMAAVLTHIIERDTRNAAVLLPRKSTQPFPSVLHRTVVEPVPSGRKQGKKSLFAQQMALSTPVHFGVALQQEVQKHGEILHEAATSLDQDSTSKIIHGTGLSASLADEEAKKIHSENLDQLASMSEQEILEEQRKLLQTLDPKLIEYLKNLKTGNKSSEQAMEVDGNKMGQKSTATKAGKKKQKVTPDLPLAPQKEWLHMDKIEYDKLEWMKEMPPPVTGDSKTGKPARFDFSGNLLQADADIPVTKGLHHHGDEPERAGYTLEEMFSLARSTNIQQRILALQTLTRVITKAKYGGFTDMIQTPVLPSIIDGGVVFLLRWSLDDSVDAVVYSAVAAMHALLCNMADEDCQDRVVSWFQGHTVPSLRPSSAESVEDSSGDKPEETDADIAKRDLILALVTRMRFLQRLLYILETQKPQSVTVVQVLNILTRIASHSASMAYEIVHCPRLVDLIVQEFLPTAWNPLDCTKPVSEVYGVPLPAALRLVRKICQAGRNMASTLSSSHHLQTILLRYIAVKPRDMQLPFGEAFSLQTESFRTWRICLSYGLSAEIYVDLYSTLVKYLQSTQQRLTADTDLSEEFSKDADMLSCLESVVLVAATSPDVPGFTRSQDGTAMETESSQSVTSSAVIWSHVTDLLQPITLCFKCVLNRIKDSYQFKKCDLQFATSCVNLIATFYSKLEHQPSYDPVDCLQQIEILYRDIFLPCWKSLGFQVILESLSKHSNLLSGLGHGTEELMTSLPELKASFPERKLIQPVLSPHSPFSFLTACLRLVSVFCRLHKGLIDEVHRDVVIAGDIVSYMKKMCSDKPSPLRSNHFTRYENIFQFYLIKLSSLKAFSDGSLFHQCGLQLLTRLHHGDEHLAHDILSTVVFNTHFISEGKEDEIACQSMSEMKLGETTHLRSATQEEITVTRSQLMQDACSCLPSIRTTYLTAFSMWEKLARQSRFRYLQLPLNIETFLTSQPGECLLPCDWMYLPLVDLFNKFSVFGSSGSIPPNLVTMASDVLRWVFLLECWRPNILTSISVTLKISRVMCAFMAGNDLFLERSVHNYMAALLREYTKPRLLDKMNFNQPIPGLASFYELYLSLLEQYEAVSFGDSLFGCYILLPLQQNHASDLRKVLWGEKPGILRSLHVPVKEFLIPIERYLSPDESDIDLLKLYFGHLMSETVRAQWSPVMYLIAVHHVNRFLYYSHDNTHLDLRNKMWHRLLVCKLEEVKKHLIYYKTCDTACDFSMALYTELPPNREKLLTIRNEDMKNKFP